MRTASVVRTLRRGVAVYLYMLIGCVGVSVGSAVEIDEIRDIETIFGMFLTANARQSRRVWTSIGIGMNMKLFLGKLEWLNLQ